MSNISENKPKVNKNLLYFGIAGLAALIVIGIIVGVVSSNKQDKSVKSYDSKSSVQKDSKNTKTNNSENNNSDKSQVALNKSEDKTSASSNTDNNQITQSSNNQTSQVNTETNNNNSNTSQVSANSQAQVNNSNNTNLNNNSSNNNTNNNANNNTVNNNSNNNNNNNTTSSVQNNTQSNQQTNQTVTNNNNNNNNNGQNNSQNTNTQNLDTKKARETIEDVALLRFQKGPDFNPATASREELKNDPLVVTMTALSFDNMDAKVGVSVKYSHIGDENFKEGRMVIKLDPRLKVDTSTIKDNFNNQGFKAVDGAVYNPQTNEIIYGPGTFNTNPSQMKPGESGEIVFKAIIPKGAEAGEYRITSQMVESTTKQANPKNVIILDVKKAKV